MKPFTSKGANCANQSSKISQTSAVSNNSVRRRVLGWVGVSALSLAPLATLAVAGDALAGCGNYTRAGYRGYSCNRYYGRSVAYVRPVGVYTGGLQLGAAGPAVATLQQRLTTLGFPVAIDGLFGYQTDQALRAFQASVGLVPDGVVGPATTQALASGGGYYAYNRPAAYPAPVAPVAPIAPVAPAAYAAPIAPVAPVVPPIATAPIAPPIATAPVINRYVVLIPSSSQEELTRVRAYAPQAFISGNRLGSYIQAAAYPERGPADSFSSLLRSRGFDSQVRFMPF